MIKLRIYEFKIEIELKFLTNYLELKNLYLRIYIWIILLLEIFIDIYIHDTVIFNSLKQFLFNLRTHFTFFV
jgi:hypothetical protein